MKKESELIERSGSNKLEVIYRKTCGETDRKHSPTISPYFTILLVLQLSRMFIPS